jgi:hypothetical protein
MVAKTDRAFRIVKKGCCCLGMMKKDTNTFKDLNVVQVRFLGISQKNRVEEEEATSQ